jgi:hypothetical protein
MRRLPAAVLGGAMLASCSLAPFDPCPCAEGSCQIELDRCIALSETPVDLTYGCVVHTNHRLYCTNQGGMPGDPLYASPMVSTDIVDHMTSTFSWFRCWTNGEPHTEGTLWYSTKGDDTSRDGWLPGDKVNAPEDFERDPTKFGFMPCAAP